MTEYILAKKERRSTLSFHTCSSTHTHTLLRGHTCSQFHLWTLQVSRREKVGRPDINFYRNWNKLILVNKGGLKYSRSFYNIGWFCLLICLKNSSINNFFSTNKTEFVCSFQSIKIYNCQKFALAKKGL